MCGRSNSRSCRILASISVNGYYRGLCEVPKVVISFSRRLSSGFDNPWQNRAGISNVFSVRLCGLAGSEIRCYLGSSLVHRNPTGTTASQRCWSSIIENRSSERHEN
jgi:hypothetical protein